MQENKRNHNFLLLFLALLLVGCFNNQQKLKPNLSPQTFEKAVTTPTPLAITAFEKVCVDNAFSADDMIKAAKAYSVGDVNTQTHTYKGKSITTTSMKTTDNTMEFFIFSPSMDCQVRVFTGKSLIFSALFLEDYNNEAKILDIKLGMMLTKKFGNDITISREVKDVSRTTNKTYIAYGPTYAHYDNGKLIRYSLKPNGHVNTLNLSHD